MTDLTPSTWFAAQPGSDGTLLDREEIRTWLRLLAAGSSHAELCTFGVSTEGRPMDALFIGDVLTRTPLVDLAAARARAIDSLRAGDSTGSWEMPVALITSGIHATEIGGPQSIPELVYWLVTSSNDEAQHIRRRLLVIVVPTLNPDGMDLVRRWRDSTASTPDEGSEPPLLYHRFAGHDNNRDWLYQNLVETRNVMQELHATWYPHVTLDQHQMSPHGPRFALPPYADPWEPNIHPSIVAASSALGQSIATDMTLAGRAGVMTGRYFDAWEPSRAIQHYRGGVRILAEAASAKLAWPIDVTRQQLIDPPLPQPMDPSTSLALPWHGGTWTLRDIVDYHVDAARSLLRHVSRDPGRWIGVQKDALTSRPSRPVAITIPGGRWALDRSANQRLVDVLRAADVPIAASLDDGDPQVSTGGPNGSLAAATLLPKRYPSLDAASPYDVTSHYLPLAMGATVSVAPHAHTNASDRRDESHRFLVIDARCHQAPNAIEPALAAGTAVWRMSAREFLDSGFVESGSWIIDSEAVACPEQARRLSTRSVATLPSRAEVVRRRDVTLLGPRSAPSTDHGWTRWWLQARSIPHLEGSFDMARLLLDVAETSTVVIADTASDAFEAEELTALADLVAAGATVLAFGRAGRTLAPELSELVSQGSATPEDRRVRAPGALLRLLPELSSSTGSGLDRAIPMMFERDGTFSIDPRSEDVQVLGRIARRDTLISGWMPDADAHGGAPVIIQVGHGRGRLVGFSFRPLFRAQMLVTSPIVHNLLYTTSET